jgi:hypothetical protein
VATSIVKSMVLVVASTVAVRFQDVAADAILDLHAAV